MLKAKGEEETEQEQVRKIKSVVSWQPSEESISRKVEQSTVKCHQ